MSFPRLLYSLVLALLTPLIVLRLIRKSLQTPAYRQRMGERFGFLPAFDQSPKIWLHAVSVGETMAAKDLIESLVRQYGEGRVLVTTTTPTGSDTVKRLFGSSVAHRYFPYDLPLVVDRYLAEVKPDILLVMETEIWPNLWAACQRHSVPIMMINARLSAKATRRYQKLGGLVGETLNRASLIGCRNAGDVDNFRLLGAAESRLSNMGDLKLDIRFDSTWQSKADVLKKGWGEQRRVWVAASTHEGEDQQILAMHQRLLVNDPELLLILVPRHPERFDTVAALIAESGLRFQRRSETDVYGRETEVVLGDSMGEMLLWYAAADVVVMGGSLVRTGGHNPVEALVAAAPVLSGPHVFNFPGMFEMFDDAGVKVAVSAQQLEQYLADWLNDEAILQQQIQQAQAILAKNSGAVAKYLREINRLLIIR